MATSEGGIISDVLAILKRLETSVSDKDGAESASLLSALDALPITLPVLTKTKCGVAVARLRANEHAGTSSKAGELVKKWKKVAEDAGVGAAPARASSSSISNSSAAAASSSVAAPNGSASSTPAPTISAPSDSASQSSAGLASPTPAPKPYVPTGLARVALPAGRAKPREFLMNTVTTIVKTQLAAAAANPLPDALPQPSPEDAAAQAADVGAAIEDALFAAFGNPDPSRPGDAYAQRFRMLVQGLPRNPVLTMNMMLGAMPASELVQYTAEQLASDESKRKAEEIRKHQ